VAALLRADLGQSHRHHGGAGALLDNARRIFDSETWHEAGLRDYELHEWEVHQAVGVGTFTVEAADAVFGHTDE
jgi:hypothetical protein